MSWSSAVPVRIMTVCTMNICRSPGLEQALSVASADTGLADLVALSSAGTNAELGLPRCPVSISSSDSLASPVAQPVQLPELQAADLILTAEREHVSKLIRLDPALRTRAFPALMAARLATWVVEGGALSVATDKSAGRPLDPELDWHLSQTSPLPELPAERLRWLVTEMDAARGIAPTAPGTSDDIPDPHVLGDHLHPEAARLVAQAATQLTGAFEVTTAD